MFGDFSYYLWPTAANPLVLLRRFMARFLGKCERAGRFLKLGLWYWFVVQKDFIHIVYNPLDNVSKIDIHYYIIVQLFCDILYVIIIYTLTFQPINSIVLLMVLGVVLSSIDSNLPRRKNTQTNTFGGEPRTEEESRSIFEDGYQFLKIYKSLTCISLRLGPICGCYLKDSYSHNLAGLVSFFWHVTIKHTWIRLGIQEWFLRPKCHVSWISSFMVFVFNTVRMFSTDSMFWCSAITSIHHSRESYHVSLKSIQLRAYGTSWSL